MNSQESEYQVSWEEYEELRKDLEHERKWKTKAIDRLSRLLHNVGPCPHCGADEAEGLRSISVDGKNYRCPHCNFTAGCMAWPDADYRNDYAIPRKKVLQIISDLAECFENSTTSDGGFWINVGDAIKKTGTELVNMS
jgi:hypothetical protein